MQNQVNLVSQRNHLQKEVEVYRKKERARVTVMKSLVLNNKNKTKKMMQNGLSNIRNKK